VVRVKIASVRLPNGGAFIPYERIVVIVAVGVTPE